MFDFAILLYRGKGPNEKPGKILVGVKLCPQPLKMVTLLPIPFLGLFLGLGEVRLSVPFNFSIA